MTDPSSSFSGPFTHMQYHDAMPLEQEWTGAEDTKKRSHRGAAHRTHISVDEAGATSGWWCWYYGGVVGVQMTPLVTGEIAEDFAQYLADSEQINSAVGLGVSINRDASIRAAGGFIVQV